MVSALRANEPLAAPPAVRHYMVAKLLADERLEASRVPSTILRPGRLTDEPAGGRICVDPSEATGYDVSRENVALCILAALDSFAHEDRTIDLVDGNTAIKDVFSA